MSQSASDQLKLINAGSIIVRLGLIVLVALAFFGSWRAARWYMGSEFALIAPYLPEDALTTAQTAVDLSPSDPLAHRALGSIEQTGLTPQELQASIREFERAVSLSPNDFRLWVDLGRALEQAGDDESAERAFRRGVELAPFYSWPRWHLGNFLLRRGRYEEALSELRRVAEADPTKRSAVFDLAWYVYSGDAKMVGGVLGNAADVREEFVSYLLGRGRLDEALKLWSGLSVEERRAGAGTTGRQLFDHLVEAKRYRDALNLAGDLVQKGAGGQPEVGKVTNGSFENSVSQTGALLFEWKVPSGPQASAALDPKEPQQGALSLRINFNAPSAVDFNITQVLAVEPSSSYRLQFYVRSNNLKSASTPVVQVISPDGGRTLAESAPAPTGKADWQQVTIEFKTPPDLDGVTLRITRPPCTAEGAVCPIFGTVWYDNFNLELLGRDAGVRATGRNR